MPEEQAIQIPEQIKNQLQLTIAQKLVGLGIRTADGQKVAAPPTREERDAEKRKKHVEMIEREGRAIHFRKRGMNYAEIGAQMGVIAGVAQRLVRRGLKRLLESSRGDGDYVRAQELETLNDLQGKMYVQLDSPETPPELMQGAVDRLLRIQERRAKYLGLDVKQPAAQADAIAEAKVVLRPMLKGASTKELEELIAKLTEREANGPGQAAVSEAAEEAPTISHGGDDGARRNGAGAGDGST